MNIYTFFEPIGLPEKIEQEKKIIEIWKKSWKYYGWNPIILSLEDAKKNNKFEIFKTKCESFPTVNDKEYELLCFLRWLAFAEYGGWICDYDMINYGFEPFDPQDKNISLAMARRKFATIFHMSKQNYNKYIIEMILKYEISNIDFITINEEKKYHVSDMTIMANQSDQIHIDLFFDEEEIYCENKKNNQRIIHFAKFYLNQSKYDSIINYEKTKIFYK